MINIEVIDTEAINAVDPGWADQHRGDQQQEAINVEVINTVDPGGG